MGDLRRELAAAGPTGELEASTVASTDGEAPHKLGCAKGKQDERAISKLKAARMDEAAAARIAATDATVANAERIAGELATTQSRMLAAEAASAAAAQELASVAEKKQQELQDMTNLCEIEMLKLQKTHDKKMLTTLELAKRIGSILSPVDGERGRAAAAIRDRITAEDLLSDLNSLIHNLDLTMAGLGDSMWQVQ